MTEKESVQGKGGGRVQFLLIPIPTAIFAADTGAPGTLLMGPTCNSCSKGLGDEGGLDEQGVSSPRAQDEPCSPAKILV